MAKGFAAVVDGERILVDTVSPTDSAAMVNWLAVHAGFLVLKGMGDFAIREHFARLSKERNVKIAPVDITYG